MTEKKMKTAKYIVGCLILLASLAIQGRLPFRAVMVPVLPAAALVFCLIPDCLPNKRWFVHGFCAVLVILTGIGFTSKVILAFLMTVVVAAMSAYGGVQTVEPALHTLLTSLYREP